MIRALVLGLLLAAGFSANATQVRLSGVYSNLRYVNEAGDLIGMEVFIVFGGGEKNFYAILQCAEGWPSKPVVVPVTIKGNDVEFAAHSDSESHCPKAKFKGSVSTKGLKGTFDGTDYPKWLPRKRSYWQ